MIETKLISTPLVIVEQVREATHWAIQFGEIVLPSPEVFLIEDCNANMDMFLRIVFRMYIRSLATGNYDLSAKISTAIPCFMDPYLPGICAEAGIDNSTDEYLDEIDEL